MSPRRRPAAPPLAPLAPLALLALLALAAATGCRDAAATHVEGVGTLELVTTDVAPLTSARVVAVRVREGDAVRRGDTLVVLALPDADARVAAGDAQADAAAATAADVAAGARAPELRRLAADLRATEAEAARLRRDAERAAALHGAGAISPQQREQAATAAAVADERRAAAAAALRLAREGARAGQARAARAQATAARATAEGVRAAADALVLLAPADGTVLGRHAEPGEVLAPGEAALTLGDPRRPWTRVYLSQRDLPLVRRGDAVEARLDALPERPIAGRVASIADRAEFTPRVALTEEERDDLLFGVRVEFDDTTGVLHAGLPVTVRLARRP